MLLSSLVLLLLPVLSAAAPKPPPACLQSGTERQINEALTKGGRNTIVTLCQGSTHRLNSSIVFSAPSQTLATEGNPKGRERAMLIVEGEDQAVAIKADCKLCGWAKIRSLIIDGNRPVMLRVPKGGGLIELGNAEGQEVRDCRLYEPRGWTALHFREGDSRNCRKAHVVDNDIGPCGEEWDDEYDGVSEPEPINGNPRADGISLACQDSLVERNIVTDATDGGIVIFGSPGTEVRENHVYSRTRTNLGGINLVDYDPWKGDYFGVKVHHNTIHALAGFLKVGIVVGPSSWSDDTDTVVHSGSVTDNTFEGTRFGYALVVSSADAFTVLRNTVNEHAAFSGVPGPRCPNAPMNGPPMALLMHRGSAKGTFQTDFVNGEVQHIICINPPDQDGVPYKPWRYRDSPAAAAKARAADDEKAAKVSFDSRLAEAVVSYQLKLLTAMNGINDRIEKHNHPVHDETEEDAHAHSGKKGKTGISEIDLFDKQLGLLESGERNLQKELEVIQREMLEMTKKYKKAIDDNKPILTDVYKNVALMKSPVSASTTIRDLHGDSHEIIPRNENGLFGPVTALLGSGAILAIAVSVVRRYKGIGLFGKKGKRY